MGCPQTTTVEITQISTQQKQFHACKIPESCLMSLKTKEYKQYLKLWTGHLK
jgi:hypothetical protein